MQENTKRKLKIFALCLIIIFSAIILFAEISKIIMTSPFGYSDIYNSSRFLSQFLHSSVNIITSLLHFIGLLLLIWATIGFSISNKNNDADMRTESLALFIVASICIALKPVSLAILI